MTRIFSDGAEFGDMLPIDFSGGANITGANYRSGIYSYTLGNGGYIGKSISGSNSELYVRFGIKNNSPEQGTSNLMPVFRNGTTSLVSIRNTPSGDYSWGAYVSGTLVEDSEIPAVAGQWYLIEVYVKIADSGGRIVVKVDGVQVIDYTGDTKPTAATTIDNLYWQLAYNGGQVDDIAINDINGAVDNSWCGDGHYEALMANDNGDVNDWDGSDGDSVNNYLLVDERPYDSDTTYVKTSVTEQDMYNVGDYDPTGGKIVTRIFSECRAKDNAALGGAIKLGFKHGGTVYLSDERILASSYGRIVGDETLLDPSDSTTWSEADLDAIQFVVECSSSSSSTSSSSSSSSTTSSSSSIP